MDPNGECRRVASATTNPRRQSHPVPLVPSSEGARGQDALWGLPRAAPSGRTGAGTGSRVGRTPAADPAWRHPLGRTISFWRRLGLSLGLTLVLGFALALSLSFTLCLSLRFALCFGSAPR